LQCPKRREKHVLRQIERELAVADHAPQIARKFRLILAHERFDPKLHAGRRLRVR